MMKLYHPGEKSRAVCHDCERLVSTTFRYKDVSFSDGAGCAHNILASVCDDCGAVVAVPAQSTPAIHEARKRADVPLEVSLPATEVDILDAAVQVIDPAATSKFRKTMFVFYIKEICQDLAAAGDLNAALDGWLSERENIRRTFEKVDIPKKRLSFKISPHIERDMIHIMESSGLSKTSLVRGVIMKIHQDVIVKESKRVVNRLKDLAAVVNA